MLIRPPLHHQQPRLLHPALRWEVLANLPMGGATGPVDSGAGSSRDTSVDVMLRLLQENLALGTLARQQAQQLAQVQPQAQPIATPPVPPSDASASPPMTASNAKAKQLPKHRAKQAGPKSASAKDPVKAKGAAKAEAELRTKSIPVRKDMTVPSNSQNKSSSEEPGSPDEKEEEKKKKKKKKGKRPVLRGASQGRMGQDALSTARGAQESFAEGLAPWQHR